MPPLDGHIADLTDADGAPPLAQAFLRHQAWLTAILTRRYGREAAEDLAQDTYLRAHAYAPAEPIRRPRSMLARIALNLAANRFRKAARETLADPADPAFARLAAPSDQDEAVFLQQMLLALPPKLRDVFVLNHVRGLTYREIAALIGISEKAVEKRMSQAIARCRDAMRS